MDGINIGVLGCSSRTKGMLDLLLKLNNNHKVVAVHDENKEAMKAYESHFGDLILYEDSTSLIKNKDLDWIFVGSTNNLHSRYIIDAMNSGKSIFSEKPLVISISECEGVLNVFRNKKPKFVISYPLRYSPHYKKIKQIVDSGEIGKIVSVEFNEVLRFNHGAFIMADWRRFTELSGGHILEKCCHDISLMNWITKSKAKKVASFGGLNIFKPENSYVLDFVKSQLKNSQDSYIKWKKNPFTSGKDIVDNQVAIIEYENGIRATFHTNISSGLPERRMYICGTLGTIRADLFKGTIEMKKIGPNEEKFSFADEENKGGHGGGDIRLIEKLNNVMFGEETHEEIFLDSIISVITCLAIDESMNKEEVISLDNMWKRFNL